MLTGSDLEKVVRSIRLVVFDFDGVFTDNTVYVSEDGRESVRCWRGDGLGLRKLERLGIPAIVISTETNAVVQKRAAKLRIECQNGVEDKYAALTAVTARFGVSMEQVAFVGNDINDAVCLGEVGLPIGVADSHPDIDSCIRYRTRARGGQGAVREVCDLFEVLRGD